MPRPLLLATLIASLASTACVRPIVVEQRPVRTVVVSQSAAPRMVKIPPGHYPAPGQCRLWYPGRPPGRQPEAVRCSELRNANGSGAFILYNSKAWDADYDWRIRDRTSPGTVPSVIVQLTARR